MSSNKRVQEFIDTAKQKGFTVNLVDTTGGGHHRAEVTSAAGVTFTAFLPKTSSDRRGHLNFVSLLKSLEHKAQLLGKSLMKTMPITLESLDKSQTKEVQKILSTMAKDQDFLILSYLTSLSTGQCQYFFNNSRKIRREDALASAIFYFLLDSHLIQLADEKFAGRKQCFALTEEGYKAGCKILAKDFKEPQDTVSLAPAIMHPQPQVNLTPEKREVGAFQSERELLIANSLGHLSLDDLKSVIYYGLEFHAESLQSELDKKQLTLNKIKETAKWIS